MPKIGLPIFKLNTPIPAAPPGSERNTSSSKEEEFIWDVFREEKHWDPFKVRRNNTKFPKKGFNLLVSSILCDC